MKRIFLLTAVLAGAAFGQQASYTVTQSTSLTAAAEVVTVQLNSSPTTRVSFKTASVFCSAACTFTVERDGSAASTTALAINPVDASTAPASSCSAFHASNVGSGTVLSQYTLAAGQLVTLDLTAKHLLIVGQNLTIRTNSFTGTAQIQIQWSEQ